MFAVLFKQAKQSSPFDVPGIKISATKNDLLDVIQDSRSRNTESSNKPTKC